jgi:thiol-disulfide isomerase/thioredoxin
MLFRTLTALLFTGVLFAQTPAPGQMTAAQAAELEAGLQANPDNLASRTRLLAYYTMTSQRDAAGARLPRRTHILWLIEHQPDNPNLRTPMGSIMPAADPEGYPLVAAAWKKHFAGEPPAAAVYTNAVYFLDASDGSYAATLAREGLARYPKDGELGAAVGRLYGLTILGAKGMDRYGRAEVFDDAIAKSDAAGAARRELETTANSDILAGAGDLLATQSTFLRIRGRTAQAAEANALAQGYLERAMKVAPSNPRAASALRRLLQMQAAPEREPAKQAALLERAAALPGDPRERWYLLGDLAKARFAMGATARAAEAASELLEQAPGYASDWNYGNAIHWGNIVLGRIALKEGRTEEAAKRLVAAGGTKGSPQLDSFGPDWDLARDLVNKDEKAAVLEYIDLCRKFWKLDHGALDFWAAAIRDGGVPSFSRLEAITGGRGPEKSLAALAGKPAPAFELKDLAGKKMSIAGFQGKTVLLDFWATWCAPCRQEMPTFEKLHREFAGKDVVILTVDVDEPEAVAAQYMKDEKLTFPVLIAEGTDTVARYGVMAFPTTLAIDAEGHVAAYAVGGRKEAELRELIGKAKK